MNKVLKFLAPVAMAVAVLWAPNASAAAISNVLNPAGATTYLGALNSLTSDNSTFNHNPFTSSGSFTDIWVFNFSPIGSAQSNASFTPFPGTFTSFDVSVYAAAANVPCGAIGATCSAFTQGSLIAAGSTTYTLGYASGSAILMTGLSAGTYAVYVTGNLFSTVGASYNGQVSTKPVPEPASLALVGVALMGLALSTRKRKSS